MTRAKPLVEPDSSSVVPSILPPEGTPAQIKTEVRYSTMADIEREPRDRYRGRSYERAREDREELEALAQAEAENLAPPDELSAFCEEFSEYTGWSCVVVRLPDPAIRRTPGSQYKRPCFEMERLGETPFDPVNLVGTLQMLNGNSGGVFRIWLADANGALVPGARVNRIVVADPPHPNAQSRDLPVPYYERRERERERPPEKSDTELRMERLQEQILQAAFDRMLNPPVAAPISALSGEDQAALFLFKQTNFLGTMFERMTALAQNPADAVKELSWRDRAIDAGVELVRTNPAIVERVSGVVERIVARVLPDPRLDGPPAPVAGPAAQSAVAMPAPQLSPPPPPAGEGEEEDSDIMDILDGLIGLINSKVVITADNPVLIELYREYPYKFRRAAGLIAGLPLEEIIDWVSSQSPLYESLLNSEVSGPYLRGRIGELQMVFRAAAKAAAATPAPSTVSLDSAPEAPEDAA